MAVNPANPRNLIGAWQQDVYSTRSARGALAAYSADGGGSWQTTPLPFTGCAPNPMLEPTTGQPYDAVYDNWVSIGPDGTAYTTAVGGNATTFSSGVVAATSYDGGAHWGNAQSVIDSPQNLSGQQKTFNDKPAVTADPAHPGVAYVVWDQLQSPSKFPINSTPFYGPTFFAKTFDGGRTWSTPRVIYDPGEKNQTIGNEIIVANGVLFDFFDLMSETGTAATAGGGSVATHVALISSRDGGQTWSGAHLISAFDSVGVSDPNTGAAVTAGDFVALAPAWDPMTGTLIVAWQDGDLAGGRWDEIAWAASADLGHTWSAPAQLNTQYAGPAFNPSIAVATDGSVDVEYYDFRSLPATDTMTLPTSIWVKSLAPGSTTFGADQSLWPPTAPFDLMRAPVVNDGYFIGDYVGLAFAKGGVVSLLGAVGSNPSDIFAASP